MASGSSSSKAPIRLLRLNRTTLYGSSAPISGRERGAGHQRASASTASPRPIEMPMELNRNIGTWVFMPACSIISSTSCSAGTRAAMG